jgi:phytoene dehydrogenase-like protein
VLADSYDVILIGKSLPGLVASALVARKGHRVLVLDPASSAETVSPVFKSDGFIFPKGSLLFLGLHREGLYEKIFTELGLSLSLLKKEGSVFVRPVPPFQLLLPAHRLNFSSKWEEFLEEIRREFPQELQEFREFSKTVQETGRILNLFHHLPFPQWRPSFKERYDQFFDLVRYWFTLRRLKRVSALDHIESFRLSVELQKLIELICLFFYRRPLSDLYALDLVSLLDLVHQEVVEVRGGDINLKRIFISRLKEYRGEFLTDTQLSGILEERGEIRGVKLEGDRIIKGRAVLMNPPKLPGTSTAQRSGVLRESQQYSYTMFFEIDEEVLPSAMMEHLLFTLDVGRPLQAGNFLYLHLTSRNDSSPSGNDKSNCPKGKRGLRVTCLLPFDQLGLPSDREALRKRVLDHLGGLMPFSEGRIGYLGDHLEDPEIKSFSGFPNPSYKLKKVQRYGTNYYTTSLRNLFFLPEEGQSLGATQEGVKSGWDIAQRLTRSLAAELQRR